MILVGLGFIMPKYIFYLTWKNDIEVDTFSKVHMALPWDALCILGYVLEHLWKTVGNIAFINVLWDFWELIYRHLKTRVVYPKGRTDVLTYVQMSTMN